MMIVLVVLRWQKQMVLCNNAHSHWQATAIEDRSNRDVSLVSDVLTEERSQSPRQGVVESVCLAAETKHKISQTIKRVELLGINSTQAVVVQLMPSPEELHAG